MKLDRKALERLSTMSDAQLRAVIETLMSDYHLDLSALRITPCDMDSLRRALRSASDEELMQLIFETFEKGLKQ